MNLLVILHYCIEVHRRVTDHKHYARKMWFIKGGRDLMGVWSGADEGTETAWEQGAGSGQGKTLAGSGTDLGKRREGSEEGEDSSWIGTGKDDDVCDTDRDKEKR